MRSFIAPLVLVVACGTETAPSETTTTGPSAGGGGSSSSSGAAGGVSTSAPDAVITVDADTGEVPLTVSFSGASSTDPDGDIESYAWSFDAGLEPATGVDATQLYLAAGSYTATLTVRDTRGNEDSDTVTINVAAETCPTHDPGQNRGLVSHAEVNELSGIAASRANPDVLYGHNDSGDYPRIFAIRASDAAVIGEYNSAPATANDWEDIAVGPGPEPDASYIYIGDVGDNGSQRPNIVVYRVREPIVSATQQPVTADLDDADRLELTYPDGAHNCETLMIDPVDGAIYVVVKSGTGVSGVYRKSAPHDPATPATMELVATLQFGAAPLTGSPATTGGDIAPYGNQILIRSYNAAYVWTRDGGATIGEALSGEPCPVPTESEQQGEAIGYAADGLGYITVSENANADPNQPEPLWFFARGQ